MIKIYSEILINAKELKEKIESGHDFILIDVLSKNSFEARHIKNSINIPLEELGEMAPEQLPNKNKEIIVYCASKTCPASPTAARKLEEMGYKNVIDFEDGLTGWQEAGYEFKE